MKAHDSHLDGSAAGPASRAGERHASPPTSPTQGGNPPPICFTVDTTPEVLDIAKQRICARLEAAIGNSHVIPAGQISDLVRDLEGLARIYPRRGKR